MSGSWFTTLNVLHPCLEALCPCVMSVQFLVLPVCSHTHTHMHTSMNRSWSASHNGGVNQLLSSYYSFMRPLLCWWRSFNARAKRLHKSSQSKSRVSHPRLRSSEQTEFNLAEKTTVFSGGEDTVPLIQHHTELHLAVTWAQRRWMWSQHHFQLPGAHPLFSSPGLPHPEDPDVHTWQSLRLSCWVLRPPSPAHLCLPPQVHVLTVCCL